MAVSIGDLTVGFVLDSKQMAGIVGQVQKSFTGLGGSLMKTAGLFVFTKAVASFGKEIVQTSSDFASKLQRTYSIMGDVTEQESARIRKEALRIGEQSSFSAMEVADAMQTLAMAGWKPEGIERGTEAIIRMAEVAGTKDVGRVAGIVTTTLGAFRYDPNSVEGAKAAKNLANILTVTATNTNTTVMGLGEALSYAANKAGALGFDMKDTAMMLGLFGDMGMQGSRAGTTLMQVINGLSGTTKKNKDALAMLGEDFSLFDAEGKAKPLVDVLGQMRDITKDWTDQQRVAFAQMLGGTRGSNGVLAVLNTTDEKWAHMIELYKGIPEDMAENTSKAMLDTLAGAIIYMKSAFDTLKINLGTTLEEPLKNGVRLVTQIINGLNTMEDWQFSGAMKLIGVLAAAGPVLGGLGTVTKLLPAITAGIVGLTSPVGMLSLGILGIGVAAIDADNEVGRFIESAAQEFDALSEDIVDGIVTAFPEIGQRMANFFASLESAAATAIPAFIDVLSAALVYGMDAISGNTENIRKIGTTIIKTLADSIAEKAPAVIHAGLDLASNLALGSLLALPTLVDATLTLAESVWNGLVNYNWSDAGLAINRAISTAFTETKDVIATWLFGDEGYNPDTTTWNDIGKKLVEKLQSGIQDAAGVFRDFLGGLILGDNYDPSDSAGDFGKKIVDAIFDGADDAVSGASGFVQGILSGIGEMFSSENIASASEALQGVIGRIMTRAGELISNLGTEASSIITAIGDVLFGKGEDGESTISAGVTALTSIISDIFTAISTDIIPNLGTAASDILTAIANVLFGEGDEAGALSVGTTALTGLITDLFTTLNTQVIPSLGGVISDLFTAIANVVSDPANMTAIGEGFGNLFGAIITGLADFASSIATEFANLSEGLGPDIEDGSSAILDGISAFAMSIINALAQAIPKLATAGMTLLTALASVFTDANVGDWMAGAIDLADNLISAIGEALSQPLSGDSSLGATVGTFVGNLINTITNGIAFLPQLAEDTVSVGAQIIDALLAEISSAFSSAQTAGAWNNLGQSAAALVQTLMSAITSAITNLPQVLEGAASAGMQIVSAIMESISSFLGQLDADDFGTQFGKAITDLVHNLLTGITNLGNSDDFKTFFTNLCNGMISALGSLGAIIGSVASEIVTYLFSGQAITDIFNAGVSFIGILLQGLAAGIAGAGNFLWSLVKGLLGIEGDVEAYQAATDMKDAYEEAFIEVFNTPVSEMPDTYEGFDEALLAALLGSVYDNEFGDAGKEAAKKWFAEFGVDMNDGMWSEFKNRWDELTRTAFQEPDKVTGEYIKGWFQDNISEAFGIDVSEVSDDVWNNLASMLTSGDVKSKNDLYAALYAAIFGDKLNPESAGAEAPNVEEVAKNAGVEVAQTASEAAQQGVTEAATGVDYSPMTEAAATSMAEGLTTAAPAVTTAADSVSRGAVETFVATMSSGEGVRIGSSFSGGIAMGILSGIGAVTAAAIAVGTAAVNALNATLKVGSPSKVTAEIGGYFDSGFANGIESKSNMVHDASRDIGMIAENAIRDYLGIHSDSDTAIEIGTYFTSGYCNGMMRNRDEVRHSGEMLANESSAGLLGGLKSAAEAATVATKTAPERVLGANGLWTQFTPDADATALPGGLKGVLKGSSPTGALQTMIDTLSQIETTAKDATTQLNAVGTATKEATNQLNAERDATIANAYNRARGGGGSQSGSSSSYTDMSSVNFGVVQVQGMDDIQQLSAEIAAARRRTSFGYGS